ncbi:hypothetical protein BDV96DRAFT_613325 [Lophiotrema nucula]|uniref:Uncharacterized protein n=1 Tax=Lophiotrema nucula TaxID=690887 RepID=A0A6A5Z4N3_9PLEO|nr:hypothetical protein BDV96DRAFT_613325 [Lophiotrema nucula]
MKSASALLFASVAAAEGYYGYASSSSSSTLGYTTVYPGHGKEPVTVTSQYQAVPTYVSEEKSKYWSSYDWVSTILKDYDSKYTTITSTTDKVIVYHTKTTKTHTSTITAPYTTATGGYAYPTGYPVKNATTSTKVWYELYEKIHEVEYCELGPKALPGYGGSGLYKEWNPKAETNYQPVEVKEYTGGKWKYYAVTYTFGAPKPSVTTYSAPGTYTAPAYEITVTKSSTAAYEEECTAAPHETVTYGGYTTDVTKPTTVTVPYGAYETHGAKTKTVVHYTTVTYTKPGHYTVIKPTTTAYETSTVIVYPTATTYEPGVYTHPVETVTITKSGEAYTCTAHHTSTYTPSSKPSTTADAYPTSTGTATGPSYPDPSSDYEEPAEEYGAPSAGYVKRGGMLERRKAEEAVVKRAAHPGKRVILV